MWRLAGDERSVKEDDEDRPCDDSAVDDRDVRVRFADGAADGEVGFGDGAGEADGEVCDEAMDAERVGGRCFRLIFGRATFGWIGGDGRVAADCSRRERFAAPPRLTVGCGRGGCSGVCEESHEEGDEAREGRRARRGVGRGAASDI